MDQDLITVLNAIVAELQGIRRELTLLAHPLQVAPMGIVGEQPPVVAPLPVIPENPNRAETQRYQVNFTLPARPGVKRPMKTL
jgi:hypothetical protein